MIAKRADAYGIPGITVDGQDAEAVYEATQAAVERARRGEGPTLIEAKTYRFDEHNVGLNINGEPYRPQEEIDDYINNQDPLVLYKKVLLDNSIPESEVIAVEQEVRDAVAQSIQFAEDSPLPDATAVYDYMYSNPINYPSHNPA